MAAFDLSPIVQALGAVRQDWRDSQNRSREPGEREFPSPNALAGVLEDLKRALFPMRLGPLNLCYESENYYVGYTLDSALHTLLAQAKLELRYEARHQAIDEAEIDARALTALQTFASQLPRIRKLLDTDVLAAYQGDPAARSVDEVLLCYPGVLAMIYHRIAHELYRLGLPMLARISSELAHAQTGIDIHPGAQIGASFFIDHGTGVVIGETAIIGERVRIYQTVTLGAKRFPADADGNLKKGQPRHPIVEDDVVIYAGATILGRVTLGRGCVIGGNVWLTHDVPPGGTIAQADSQDRCFGEINGLT
jgi:serine O-acetyltransferase